MDRQSREEFDHLCKLELVRELTADEMKRLEELEELEDREFREEWERRDPLERLLDRCSWLHRDPTLSEVSHVYTEKFGGTTSRGFGSGRKYDNMSDEEYRDLLLECIRTGKPLERPENPYGFIF